MIFPELSEVPFVELSPVSPEQAERARATVAQPAVNTIFDIFMRIIIEIYENRCQLTTSPWLQSHTRSGDCRFLDATRPVLFHPAEVT